MIKNISLEIDNKLIQKAEKIAKLEKKNYLICLMSG